MVCVTAAAVTTTTAPLTTAFLILLWSRVLSSSSALTIMRNDRIYQYVGQESNHLQGLQGSRMGSNVSEGERVDWESLIPESITNQIQPIKEQINDSYLLKGSDKGEMISEKVVVQVDNSWGAGASSSSSSSSSSSTPDPAGSTRAAAADKEDDDSANKADIRTYAPVGDPAAAVATDTIGQEHQTQTVADRTGIPDRIFIQINHVSSVDEFLEKFVLEDNRQSSSPSDSLANEHDDHGEGNQEVHVESLFRGYDSPDPSSSSSSSSGSSSASGTGSTSTGSVRRPNKKMHPMITSPAGCDVEMRTVEIKDPVNKNELYYPWCVRIPRCSGCCPSSRLQCVPTNVSFVEINVREPLCLLSHFSACH